MRANDFRIIMLLLFFCYFHCLFNGDETMVCHSQFSEISTLQFRYIKGLNYIEFAVTEECHKNGKLMKATKLKSMDYW